MRQISDNSQTQKWNKLYSEGAEYKPLNQIFFEKILDETIKMTGSRPKTALDLGCGTGDSIERFVEAGIETTGIDCSGVALKTVVEKGINAKIIQENLENIGANKEIKRQYDFLLCKLTIAFIEDKENFLASVKDMMGQKSVFCIMTPVLYKDIEYSKEDKPGIAVGYEEFRKLLKSKFKKIVEFHHDYFGKKGDTITFLTTR